MNRTGNITPHFTWQEAACPCGCEMPESIIDEVVATAGMAERVRELFGGKPMAIVSWYRCPSHQAELYRARGQTPVLNSQHLSGRALDFSIKGLAPTQIQHQIRAALWPAIVKGLEIDPGHTHIDRRPGQAVVFRPDNTVLETA